MPYRKVTLGAAWAVRLENLEPSDLLLTRCLDCGKTWRVATHSMYAQYHGYMRIKEMMFYFRCTECGSHAYGWEVLRAYVEVPKLAPQTED